MHASGCVENALKVKIVRVGEGADLPLPRYMTADSAGMDLYADVHGEVQIAPLARALVGTGLAVALPRGFEGQVRARSGLALRSGLTVLNAPGTIDADYRGEVKVLLVNLGAEAVTVRRGDRVAQLVVSPVARVRWEEATDNDALPDTERDVGGFGHTDNGLSE